MGTEHILLAILENEDGTAVRILARLGVTPEMLEDRLFVSTLRLAPSIVEAEVDHGRPGR